MVQEAKQAQNYPSNLGIPSCVDNPVRDDRSVWLHLRKGHRLQMD